MNAILAITLQAMQSDMGTMDRVGMNIANAQTPGYRREAASTASFARLVQAGGDAGADAAAPPASGVFMDPHQGTLKVTGQGLDLALSGPGWFEVATAQGPAYTRLGAFRRDTQGRLVTAQGQPVMGTAGDIQLPDGALFIDSQGRIFEGAGGEPRAAKPLAEPVARLKVVLFDAAAPAQRLGDGLVAFGAASQRPADAETDVRQGYLENSNVGAMHEMVQLLQTVRHFESLQKVAVGYDEMLGGAIRRLSDGQ
jgi:flagellar basal-body rod protein FlgG